MTLLLFFIVRVTLSFNANVTPDIAQPVGSEDVMKHYNFKEPGKVLSMESDLKEISGLSMDPSGNTLVAVQDELGKVYFLNASTGKIENSVKFWKNGDYEGVELVNEDIYVVKSTGTLYQITSPGTDDQEVIKHNDFLKEENDVEGVAWDKKNNRLLLACKGFVNKEEKVKHLYAFDLTSQKFLKQPIFSIRKKDVQDYLKTDPPIRKLDDLKDFFSKKDFNFSPSAVAIHPKTGNIYVSSSVNEKIIMVLSPVGEILKLYKLKGSMIPQPEGLCFDANGNLYLASEGKDKKGLIFQFSPQP